MREKKKQEGNYDLLINLRDSSFAHTGICGFLAYLYGCRWCSFWGNCSLARRQQRRLLTRKMVIAQLSVCIECVFIRLDIIVSRDRKMHSSLIALLPVVRCLLKKSQFVCNKKIVNAIAQFSSAKRVRKIASEWFKSVEISFRLFHECVVDARARLRVHI